MVGLIPLKLPTGEQLVLVFDQDRTGGTYFPPNSSSRNRLEGKRKDKLNTTFFYLLNYQKFTNFIQTLVIHREITEVQSPE